MDMAAWARLGTPWARFRRAWFDRGFTRVLTERQRQMLWPIVDARGDIYQWIAEAPGKTPGEVIDHILARWDGIREETRDREDQAEREKGRHHQRALVGGGDAGRSLPAPDGGIHAVLRSLVQAAGADLSRAGARPVALGDLLGANHRGSRQEPAGRPEAPRSCVLGLRVHGAQCVAPTVEGAAGSPPDLPGLPLPVAVEAS